jgi:hypothetical protein
MKPGRVMTAPRPEVRYEPKEQAQMAQNLLSAIFETGSAYWVVGSHRRCCPLSTSQNSRSEGH